MASKVDNRLRKANALLKRGRQAEAETAFRELLARNPAHPACLSGLGRLELGRGNCAKAIDFFQRSLSANGRQAGTLFNCGVAYFQSGQPTKALAAFDQAIRIRSDHPRAHAFRGKALRHLDRSDEALESYRRAIELAPDYAEAHKNAGNLLRDMGRFEEALASFDQAIACKPDYAPAYNNRGKVLKDLLRVDEAMASYDQAIALQPDYATAHTNKALLKLLLGELEEGWRLYEWRWKSSRKDRVRHFAKPAWLGHADIAGKRLLVWTEQGLGDVIQFCRYLPVLEALEVEVLFELPGPLRSLVSTLDARFSVVDTGAARAADFDMHCSIMSLPLAMRTTLGSIPAQVPYLFADPVKEEAWQRRLGPARAPRVGLVWSGSTIHNNDRNRSMHLEALHDLLRLPFEFHCLQKEVRSADGALLTASTIRLHSDVLDDFSDTAALVKAMDFVVSVDTSVAHLAGALGHPLGIMLPFVPDHRWLLERPDSPWYPGARLFRQAAPGDWVSVVDQLAHYLGEKFARQATGPVG